MQVFRGHSIKESGDFYDASMVIMWDTSLNVKQIFYSVA